MQGYGPASESLRLAEHYRQITDGELISLMVKHPDLIQRPIVVKGDSAVLCRPAETVKEIL